MRILAEDSKFPYLVSVLWSLDIVNSQETEKLF